MALLEELAGYPLPAARRMAADALGGIAVPLQLESPAGPLALISTTTVFARPST